MENDYNDKVIRVLSLYQRLMEGEVIDKEAEAAKYSVSARSIQRDISAINNFFEKEAEKSGVINTIEYDKKKGGHYLSQIHTCYMQDITGQQGVYQERDDKHT